MILKLTVVTYNNSHSNKEVILFSLFLLMPFFYYYFGFARVIFIYVYLAAIICLFYHLSSKVSKQVFWVGTLITFTCLLTYFSFESLSSYFFSIRLYFGTFLLAVILYFCRYDLPKLFGFLSIFFLSEKLLIVLYPESIFILPNYDSGWTFSIDNAADLLGGGYSFGGTRTVTGGILLAGYTFLIHTKEKRFRKLVLAAALLTSSMTVVLLFLLYLLISGVLKSNKLYSLFIFFPLSLLLIFQVSLKNARFSLQYVEFIYKNKLNQIEIALSKMDLHEFILGSGDKLFGSASREASGNGAVVGDFIFLDFFIRFGAVGVIAFFLCSALLARRETWVPILIMMAASLHYHVIFSFPGQIVYAAFLVYGRKIDTTTIEFPAKLKRGVG